MSVTTVDVPENDHDKVGFVAIWNWGNLGDGEHTAIAYDDGVEFARSTFTVTTPGTGLPQRSEQAGYRR